MRTDKIVQRFFNIPVELDRQLDDLAKATGHRKSLLMRLAVERYCDDLSQQLLTQGKIQIDLVRTN